MRTHVPACCPERWTGPAKYKRAIAEAGNTLARALKPHGGLLLYRAFA